MAKVGLPNWAAEADDWKERARRAEAEAGVTRLERQSKVLQLEAVEAHLERVTRSSRDVKRSTSWRLTAPLRRLSRQLSAAPQRDPARLIAFGCPITAARGLRALRRAGPPAGARAGLGDPRQQLRRLDLPGLQPAPGPGGRAATTSRRWCSSIRTSRSSTATSAPRCARRSPTRTSASRVRRRAGCAQHGLVGGLGHLGVLLPPLLRAGRRRAARVRDAPRGGAAARYARTGEVDTLDGFLLVLSPWAVRNTPLRRVARPVPRLRLRHLHAGPRGRPQGGDRRPQGRPPPFARALPGSRELDRRAHAARREVGRPDPRRRGGAGRLEAAGAAGRGHGVGRGHAARVDDYAARRAHSPARARAERRRSTAPRGG